MGAVLTDRTLRSDVVNAKSGRNLGFSGSVTLAGCQAKPSSGGASPCRNSMRWRTGTDTLFACPHLL